ncbi:glycosyltransferase family 2 protein [Pseudooceanicola algae]|uniref:Glycosyltransferase 2-like domain-containing protein n=1 Tax=Pseudooceanicola algae TaxID=1537215 RepID=A0A418SJS8_9RHOB|nr:glycosyltransferase family 2 protein [Pseudooceanicola algae]QPM90678.1 hypothetical protein PSAL_019170 [Pseudooceanicola algae]
MNQPLVSVILPAFRAEATLPEALVSIRAAMLDAGMPDEALEVIIASDDGRDYALAQVRNMPFLRFTPPGPIRSGAGAARNRGLAMAGGQFIAFLDADDTWAPNYLAATLPLVRRHGAVFTHSRVLDGVRPVLTLPRHKGPLTLEDFGVTGASFHPVLVRDQSRIFTDHLSQDVRHAAEVLARFGGTAPLADTFYEIRLNRGSTTAGAHFAPRVALAYDAHEAEILAGQGDMPEVMRARVAQLFRDKAALNAAFAAGAPPGQGFYDFVADRLGAGHTTA